MAQANVKRAIEDVLDLIADMVWEADDRNICTYASRGGAEMMGYAVEEIVGKTVFDFMTPEETKRVRVVLSSSIVNRKPFFNIEATLLHRDGHEIHVILSGHPVFDRHGVFRGYRGLQRDITQQKHLEKLLRLSEERQEVLLNQTGVGFFQTTPEGRILYANNAVVDLFGYINIADMVAAINNISSEIYVVPSDRDHFRTLLRENGFVRNFETRVYKKDRTAMWISLNASMRHDDRSRKVFYEGTVFDITEMKQMKSLLEKHEQDLLTRDRQLEKLNSALEVLLCHMEKERNDITARIALSIHKDVLPLIEHLRKNPLDLGRDAHLDMIEQNLTTILSPAFKRVASVYSKLSPAEVRTANLVKIGKSVKEISNILNVSTHTVHFYCQNIRSKLKLKHKAINLKTYLLSLKEE